MWRRPSPAYVDGVKLVLGELNQVCERCQLRLAGIKNPREHLNADTLSNQKNGTIDDGPPEKKRRQLVPPCRACLGVLQEDYMQDTLEKLSSEIQGAGYDADHFTISLSLPISLALRGHSLNIYLKEKFDNFESERVIPIKQIWKSLYPHRLEEKLGKQYVSGESCEFYAELQFDFEDEEKELNAVQTMCAEEYAMRAKKTIKYHMGLVTRQGAEKSIAQVSDTQFCSHYSVPPNCPISAAEASVKMYHNSIFLGGRYNKYSRELSQTPWLIDGIRKMDTSLEELISESIKETFKFDVAKFCSSGREDVDVRMLGNGRPFMFEITNPRKTSFSKDELTDIERRVNKSNDIVKVRDLSIVSKDNVKLIKEGEDQKRKTYTALCISPSPPHITDEHLQRLSQIKDLKLMQKTPIRVLHRRPNAVRERTVYEIKAERCSEENLKHFLGMDKLLSIDTHLIFRISVTTQAGTYVKEFVHGDFGRTVPNLREILEVPDLDIIALDVESIDLEWPPK